LIERQVFEHPGANSLTAVLASAAEFGLTPPEIWEEFVETADGLPEEVKTDCADELSGRLARRLLEKERQSLA
jgi:hypothetical protein